MTAAMEPKEGKGPVERGAAGAKRESRRVAEAAGRQAAALSETGKSSATNYMRGLSAAAEKSREALEGQGHKHSAQVLDRIAGEMRGLAESLEGKSAPEIYREIESFAHRRPALFFGGALLAGFGLSRFLTSVDPAAGVGPAGQAAREHEAPVSER